MGWYSLGLKGGIEDISKGAWQLAWEVSQEETGPDLGNAIFRKVGADHRSVLYFSPSSELLAESFGAKPCDKPSPRGMELLAGSDRAWRIHFGRVCSLRRRMGALPALRRLGFARSPNEPDADESAPSQHIRRLFRQADATPREGTSMPLALAAWAEENLTETQMHELRPGVDALRRAELEDPDGLDILLEETNRMLEQAHSLHDAARVLLREAADWAPTPRQGSVQPPDKP